MKIAIVAGEPSGDRLGGGLIRQLRKRVPDVQFEGVGGPKMKAEGCNILFDMDRIGVMGLDGLKEKLLDILSIRKQLISRWSDVQPDVLVAIDVPDFNLPLENRLKRHGVPSMHYVSPTVWAWRGYRIHKIKRSISHMLALFPFEAEYYQKHDVPVTCVGHPMADEISTPNQLQARQALGLNKGTVVALLPGSRRSEVRRLIEPMVSAARLLSEQYKEIQFVLPLAGRSARIAFEPFQKDLDHLSVTVIDGQSRLAMEAADVGIIASGTASLEAALLQLPHVVVYRLSTLSYWMVRCLQEVDHYAMPNHLLPKPMVPELIQNRVDAANIVEAVNGYLQNPSRTAEIKKEFANIHKSLQLGADQKAAEAVLTLVNQSSR